MTFLGLSWDFFETFLRLFGTFNFSGVTFLGFLGTFGDCDFF